MVLTFKIIRNESIAAYVLNYQVFAEGTNVSDETKTQVIMFHNIDNIDYLIENVKKNDPIILQIKDKNYRGKITKLNKFSATAFIKSLNKNITIDNHGITKIDGYWYRCMKMNKTTSLPIWINSIGKRFEEAIKNRPLDEAQKLFKGIKDYIEAFDNGTLFYK